MSAPCRLHQWLLSNLIDAMDEKELTQTDLAKEAGISEKHLSQILTGKATGSIELWDFLLLVVGVRHRLLSGEGRADG